MEDIRVSVITPSYNQGQYIEETINSVLNQTYKNIEYIIQDSCSSDNTKLVLEKYKNDSRVNIFIEKDNGQSDAINRGFKKANGELVGWINSDDILEKDCIQKIVESYKKNKDASIFFGNIELIRADGSHIRNVEVDKITYKRLLNVNPNVIQPGSFYKSDLVRNIKYLDVSLIYTMDYDLWLRLLKQNDKAVKIKSVLAKFRLHDMSKTAGGSSFFKFWKDIFYVRKKKHECKYLNVIHIYYIKCIIQAAIKKILRISYDE